MIYRQNIDEELRRLERDPSAQEQLKRARIRAGLCPECGVVPPQGHTKCLKCQPLTLTWDTSQIFSHQIEFLTKEEGLSEEEAIRMTENDEELFRFEWEHVESELTGWMNQLNQNSLNWCVTVNNFGWRRVSGYKEISYNEATTGGELLYQVLPETDCTYTIYYNGENFVIKNYHHDAPTGETYIIELAKKCPHCGNEYCSEQEFSECCKYMCENCGERWSELERVKRCCEHICKKCGQAWASSKLAKRCCP